MSGTKDHDNDTHVSDSTTPTMAVSTYTLMRTFTSVKLIATTITAHPKEPTATVTPDSTSTAVQSVNESIADPSQIVPSSSVHDTILSSISTLPVPTTSVAFASNVSASFPIDTAPTESTFSESAPSTTLTSTSTWSLTTSSTTFSISSISAADTPLFAKQPTDAIGGSQNPRPPPTAPAGLPPTESTQQPITQTASESSLQSTQESTQDALESITSHSVEKAILLPVPGTSTVVTSSDIASSNPSTLAAISTTFQTRSDSTTAASVPESTQSAGNVTPSEADSGITNPQSTFTTATLPGGRQTTIGLDATAASDQSGSASETAISVTDQDSSDSPSTPVLMGSIFGAVAAISLIMCLLWFFRRRMSKKRRSTLLTPLSLPPGGRRDEKKYEIDTASLGPTPRSTKLAAALSFYPKKISEKLGHMPANNSSAGVNMNRGNSQFLDPVPNHSRHTSVEGYGNRNTGSGRPGWWSRVIDDASSEDLIAQDMAERANYPGPAYFPSMDESRLDREAQQRRMNRGHSVSSWTDGALSPNPFADTDTMSMGSSKYYPAPLQPKNPFSDSNSITPPATAQVAPTGYVQDVQRSRGQSMGPGAQGAARRDHAKSGSFYRDSAVTNKSFEKRRNKTHSNPFDLEMDGPQPPMGANTLPPPRVPVASSIYDMPRPGSGHTRGDSFTSRYASGPGFPPNWSTMGPVSSRWDSTVGYVPIGHVRSESDASVIGPPNVGQAM